MPELNFWNQFSKPILGLSPMDGVTDHPFRHIQKKYGNPDVVYTEFTSVEGVCHGAQRLLKDFLFDETQRPIIAQVYGTTPDFFRQTAIILGELGFDAIDINMGCPAKNVAHSGAGAALIKTPKLAQEIVAAVKQGILEWQNGATVSDCPDIIPEIAAEVALRHSQLPIDMQSPRPLPVSIKTRVGYTHPVVSEWIPALLETSPAAIAVHGRTLAQQYGGLADWDQIGIAAELARSTQTKILGNGDVKNLTEAEEKIAQYNLDGILIGRAAMGDPFVFRTDAASISPQERFAVAIEHAKLFETTFSADEKYNFLPMRKHLGWYIKDIPNAKEVRIAVFKTNSAAEVEQLFNQYQLL